MQRNYLRCYNLSLMPATAIRFALQNCIEKVPEVRPQSEVRLWRSTQPEFGVYAGIRLLVTAAVQLT